MYFQKISIAFYQRFRYCFGYFHTRLIFYPKPLPVWIAFQENILAFRRYDKIETPEIKMHT